MLTIYQDNIDFFILGYLCYHFAIPSTFCLSTFMRSTKFLLYSYTISLSIFPTNTLLIL